MDEHNGGQVVLLDAQEEAVGVRGERGQVDLQLHRVVHKWLFFFDLKSERNAFFLPAMFCYNLLRLCVIYNPPNFNFTLTNTQETVFETELNYLISGMFLNNNQVTLPLIFVELSQAELC